MNFLFAASIGPVQGFIAAARRTRDLYAGSWILSEAAKAAARSLAENGAELVFPWPDADLTPRSDISISNKLLAVVKSGSPELLAATAKQATLSRLRALVSEIEDPYPIEYDGERLRRHVGEMLQFYSAWIPFPDGSDYGALYLQVEALLNSRKSTRDFAQHQGTVGLRKSSLDGGRETILTGRKARSETDLRIRADEELDGPAFLKRLVRLDRKIRFESVHEIAMRPYGTKLNGGEELYYAILMADGDRMGEAISGMQMEEQQKFSRRLSEFARTIRERLEECDCMPVFAGGDELIAMVPLHMVIEAAEAVQRTFEEKVNSGGTAFTMSAGIAIVHEMEPLDEAREKAIRARDKAKDSGRNALCITESPRSGAPAGVAGEWRWILPRLNSIVTAYMEKKLSFGFGHDLWDVLERTPAELEEELPNLARAVARHKNSEAAEGLIERSSDRLPDLMNLMLVGRRISRARARWREGAGQ